MGIVAILFLLLFLASQLSVTRNYLSKTLTTLYNQTYDSELVIGRLDGFIPFNMTLHDVVIRKVADLDATADTLVQVSSLEMQLSLVDLIRQNFRVQSLIVNQPVIHLTLDDTGHYYRLEQAFSATQRTRTSPDVRLTDFEILAPFLAIRDGIIVFEPRQPGVPTHDRPEPWQIDQIQMNAFAEFTSEQRYFNLRFLYLSLPQVSTQPYTLSGQIYNDARFFEFNGFELLHGASRVYLTGEIDGVSLEEPNFVGQLLNARYGLSIDSTRIHAEDFDRIGLDLTRFRGDLFIDAEINGTLKDLAVDRASVRYGGSRVDFVGYLGNLDDLNNFTYDVNVRELNLRTADIEELYPPFRGARFRDWQHLAFRGRLSGDLRKTAGELTMQTPRGSATLTGDIEWLENPDYFVNVVLRRLDLAQFRSLELPQGRINGTARIQGKGVTQASLATQADIKIYNSQVEGYTIDELNILVTAANQAATAEVYFAQNGSGVQATGAFSWSDELAAKITGYAENLDISQFYAASGVPETQLNIQFMVDAKGSGIDDVTGVGSLDVRSAVIGGVEVSPHQMYVDLQNLGNAQRELRFTSTFLDLGMRGDVVPSKIVSLLGYWSDYVENRIGEDFLFQESDWTPQAFSSEDRITVDLDIVAKDVGLLQLYFPDLPLVDADFAMDSRLVADRQRISLNGGLAGRSLRISETEAENFTAQFTTNFQFGRSWKDFSAVDIRFSTGTLKAAGVDFSNTSVNFSMLNGLMSLESNIRSFGDENYRAQLRATSLLADSVITVHLEEFELGNDTYLWNLEQVTQLQYLQNNRFSINQLVLKNDAQRISLHGTFSNDRVDSVMYEFNQLDLNRISDILNRRVSFQGIVNGEFYSKSLLTEPAIGGNFEVDGLSVDNRLVGDVAIFSTFNPLANRFEIDLRLQTDAQKYADYLSQNNNFGQDITVSGWLNPSVTSPSDTLFWFNADLPKIDAWILTPILPDIFDRTEGLASGSGVIFGNTETFDFEGNFDILELHASPKFLKTNYLLSGAVTVSKSDGVFLDRIQVLDKKRGTGILNGTVGFNNFLPERPLNITLQMNNLEFLNNTFVQDVPFYGNVFGTGLVSLTGTNLAPFLRTVTPVTTTSDSRLSIPLLDETTVEEQARFIEFVKSFSELTTNQSQLQEQVEIGPVVQRTFVEVFKLDLQFIAPINTTVQLVFDPLTGEELNARGSGRIRITLEDEVFQMFGNFNVSSGDYTFVGGDIFVRRFQLRDGGIISWEGDPANARLNILTAYRSRPDVGVLTTSVLEQQTRIPVDLMLEITGTIESIENNFYFEFPNAIDVSQNAAELALLNSEDQKLLQATSLLFTGGFIPVSNTADGQFSDLSTNFQSRAGQVGLSQLLSNQINAILNSNLSILDIDLNLTGFDQADLGVALRLFDDRLILRGESQFYSSNAAGNETMLGDLGVTYRINRSLSLEIFHRRDPTLRAIVGNQTQVESINGIGLEAQYQFNSFAELWQRLWGQVSRIFRRSSSQGPTIESSQNAYQ